MVTCCRSMFNVPRRLLCALGDRAACKHNFEHACKQRTLSRSYANSSFSSTLLAQRFTQFDVTKQNGSLLLSCLTRTFYPATHASSVRKRELHTTCTLEAPSSAQPTQSATFWQPDPREGSPPTKWQRKTFGEKARIVVKEGPGELVKQVKDASKRLTEHLKDDSERNVQDEDVKIFWSFRTQADVDKFIVTTDADNKGGFSTGGKMLTNNQTVLFYGYLCTEIPRDGKTGLSGYVNFSSPKNIVAFNNESWWDFTSYSHLLIKYRGDGRNYKIVLGNSGYFDMTWADHYDYPLYTCGGPYWQWAKIPFSKFVFAHKGRIQDAQQALERSQVSFVSITMMERCDGPFQLEIDYIGAYYDHTWTEEHAYELYVTRKYEAQC